jgi:hypothetical protein
LEVDSNSLKEDNPVGKKLKLDKKLHISFWKKGGEEEPILGLFREELCSS